jgi:hypothetical protein
MRFYFQRPRKRKLLFYFSLLTPYSNSKLFSLSVDKLKGWLLDIILCKTVEGGALSISSKGLKKTNYFRVVQLKWYMLKLINPLALKTLFVIPITKKTNPFDQFFRNEVRSGNYFFLKLPER